MNKYRKDYKGIDEICYIGDYYKFHLTNAEYKKMRIVIFAAIIALVLIFAAAGFLNNKGSFCIYVLFPYLCIFLPLTFLIRGYRRIPKQSQPMEYAIYDKCYNRVKFSIVGIMMASMAAGIGDVVFLIKYAQEIDLIKEGSFCIANILIAGISIFLLRYHNRIVCGRL
ncbi:hypothetical protein [Clostridium sp. E02]|uniref:hypothetical protein n=1 Tax=Clostridium sp. E02 TaxID=2487134 RepID=UPI000F52DBD9|nr:hypothetical protein [Clostridium sp. E02]